MAVVTKKFQEAAAEVARRLLPDADDEQRLAFAALIVEGDRTEALNVVSEKLAVSGIEAGEGEGEPADPASIFPTPVRELALIVGGSRDAERVLLGELRSRMDAALAHAGEGGMCVITSGAFRGPEATARSRAEGMIRNGSPVDEVQFAGVWHRELADGQTRPLRRTHVDLQEQRMVAFAKAHPQAYAIVVGTSGEASRFRNLMRANGIPFRSIVPREHAPAELQSEA